MQDQTQSYRIPCFAVPKAKLALISQWTGQSGKEYKKNSSPETAKGAGSRDDANVEFLNGAGKKKILNNNQVCNKTGS